MGLFSGLGEIASSWLEIRTLDTGSDIMIANLCEFEPLNLAPAIRTEMSKIVKDMVLSNGGRSYSNEEITLLKLAIYSGLFRGEASLMAQYNEVQKGIRKILSMGCEGIRTEIMLNSRAALNTEHKSLSTKQSSNQNAPKSVVATASKTNAMPATDKQWEALANKHKDDLCAWSRANVSAQKAEAPSPKKIPGK